MITSSLISPDFLVVSSLIIAALNLLTPYITTEDSRVRTSLLLSVSFCFFISIIIIDILFIGHARFQLSLFEFGIYRIAIHIEALGLIFLNLLSFLWIFALLYSIKYLVINDIKNSCRFLFFLNLSLIMGILIALSANLFTLFIFYELLTLSTVPLITSSWNATTKNALKQYLGILMISAMLLFLPAIIIIYHKLGHGNFTANGILSGYFSKTDTIILLLMFIFGIAKAALYPLHRWLPAAMVASYPVSALLHAVVVVKSGLFCVYKILIYIFGLKYLHDIFGKFNWLILIPIFTIFYASLKAIRSDSIKAILAYSTINQLSIALMSAFMLTSKSMGAAIMHMISHSFTKICLFYSAGNIYSLKKTNQIYDLAGISKQMPITAALLVLSIMSLIGIPPLGGFISKFYIMLAAVRQNELGVVIVLALSSLLSALYMGKMLLFIYNKPVKRSGNYGQVEGFGSRVEVNLPIPMLVATICCSLGIGLFFILQQIINQFLNYI